MHYIRRGWPLHRGDGFIRAHVVRNVSHGELAPWYIRDGNHLVVRRHGHGEVKHKVTATAHHAPVAGRARRRTDAVVVVEAAVPTPWSPD
jgi:hypothetical protein